jgi:P27 family predicted phage terminase small subunit
MAGRPRKPVEIKKLQGTYQKCRELDAPMIVELSDGVPEPPEGFSHESIKIWDTVCRELKRNGLLASCDLELLQGYCELLTHYQEATAKLKKEGAVILGRHGDKMINPWFQVQSQALKQATQLGQLFGITPSARSRISAAVVKPVSKLDSLKKPKTA